MQSNVGISSEVLLCDPDCNGLYGVGGSITNTRKAPEHEGDQDAMRAVGGAATHDAADVAVQDAPSLKGDLIKAGVTTKIPLFNVFERVPWNDWVGELGLTD